MYASLLAHVPTACCCEQHHLSIIDSGQQPDTGDSDQSCPVVHCMTKQRHFSVLTTRTTVSRQSARWRSCVIRRHSYQSVVSSYSCYLIFTQSRRVAKSVGRFQRRLFVCVCVCVCVWVCLSTR